MIFKSKFWARIFLWSLPAIAFLSFQIVLHFSDHQEKLARARSELFEGHFDLSAELYEELRDSIWFASEAQLALAVLQALDINKPPPRLEDPNEEDLRAFPSRLLLHNSLRRAQFRACQRLARFLLDHGLPYASLYSSAAHLELGNHEESRRALEAAPADFRDSWFGQRIDMVLQALNQNVSAIVQDRRGRPVGWAGQDRMVHFFPGVDPALIPDSSLRQAVDSKNGPSIRLSIDLELSQLALRALGPYRGSIVLIAPETGEILAAVSDKRTRRSLHDPAFSQRLEPASIAKLITLSAALRAGLDVDREISSMRCRGAQRYEGDFLYCTYRAGQLGGVDQAMAVSCNIAFANLGVKLGRERLLDELRLFGFNRPRLNDIEFGEIKEGLRGQRQLADLSIGLEYSDITPLHAALIATAIGSGGSLPEPTLLSSKDGFLGLSPKPLATERIRLLPDPTQISVLWNSMKAVSASGGTAHKIAPPGFPVAMKTGTASTPGRGYHTNYIGFGPLPKPEVAFSVRVTRQRTSRDVRFATRRVTQQLLRALARNQLLLADHPRLPTSALSTRANMKSHLESPPAALSLQTHWNTAN